MVSGMFGMRNYDGLCVFMCRHPEVLDYIARTINSVRDWISQVCDSRHREITLIFSSFVHLFALVLDECVKDVTCVLFSQNNALDTKARNTVIHYSSVSRTQSGHHCTVCLRYGSGNRYCRNRNGRARRGWEWIRIPWSHRGGTRERFGGVGYSVESTCHTVNGRWWIQPKHHC